MYIYIWIQTVSYLFWALYKVCIYICIYIYDCTGNVWIHTVKIKYVFVNGTPNNGPHKILDLSLGSHLIANLAALWWFDQGAALGIASTNCLVSKGMIGTFQIKKHNVLRGYGVQTLTGFSLCIYAYRYLTCHLFWSHTHACHLNHNCWLLSPSGCLRWHGIKACVWVIGTLMCCHGTSNPMRSSLRRQKVWSMGSGFDLGLSENLAEVDVDFLFRYNFEANPYVCILAFKR